jgi:hypothetical protein
VVSVFELGGVEGGCSLIYFCSNSEQIVWPIRSKIENKKRKRSFRLPIKD